MRGWRRRGADTAARRAAESTGRWAESRAALALQLKGYRVLARRLRTPVGEVDLVMRRGGLVCFVEVKARPSLTAALTAVTATQRRRIERAAQWWLAQSGPQSGLTGCDVRFDVVAVRRWRWPDHIADAWRPPG